MNRLLHTGRPPRSDTGGRDDWTELIGGLDRNETGTLARELETRAIRSRSVRHGRRYSVWVRGFQREDGLFVVAELSYRRPPAGPPAARKAVASALVVAFAVLAALAALAALMAAGRVDDEVQCRAARGPQLRAPYAGCVDLHPASVLGRAR